MRPYIDPSAIVAVLLSEPSSSAVEAFFARTDDVPLVSSFGLGECSAALIGLVRMKRKSERDTRALLSGMDEWLANSFEIVPTAEMDITRATSLVRRFELRLRLPDAIHVAIAQARSATLVTLDRGIIHAAELLGVSCINPIDPAPDTIT